MANNRLWLVHRPSGEAVILGKRMGWGWYGTPEDLATQIEAMFRKAEECDTGSQDDFVLAMEDASDAPGCTSEFVYEHNAATGLKPILEKPNDDGR